MPNDSHNHRPIRGILLQILAYLLIIIFLKYGGDQSSFLARAASARHGHPVYYEEERAAGVEPAPSHSEPNCFHTHIGVYSFLLSLIVKPKDHTTWLPFFVRII